MLMSPKMLPSAMIDPFMPPLATDTPPKRVSSLPAAGDRRADELLGLERSGFPREVDGPDGGTTAGESHGGRDRTVVRPLIREHDVLGVEAAAVAVRHKEERDGRPVPDEQAVGVV